MITLVLLNTLLSATAIFFNNEKNLDNNLKIFSSGTSDIP